jgi:predicted AlkP superfamily phosphohydrolase/phosphomutase
MLAVLNLDSVGVPLVERMLAAGRLPVLASLRARGRYEPLASPLLYFADRATAQTGVEPPEHGLYFPLQWAPKEQRLRPMLEEPMPTSVWERVSAAGRRTLLLDPYEARPPRDFSGVALSGAQFTHSVVLQRWTVPEGIDRELMRELGRPREVDDAYGTMDPPILRHLESQLLRGLERLTRSALHFLERETFDLVWAEFGAVHLAGHHFWPRETDEPAHRVWKAGVLERIYETADAAMGRMLAAMPGDADVIVFSEVGMGSNRSRTDVLPEMLRRVLGGAGGGDGGGQPGGLIWRVRSSLPARWRLRATQAVPDAVALRLWAFLHMRGVDWKRTRAFVLPSDHDAYVRLNVKGREREGIVDPGDIGALIEQIDVGLRSFRDPDGVPWVAEVHRVADALGPGANDGHLPDLLVAWNDRPTGLDDTATSPSFGSVTRRGVGVGRAGNHEAGSWILTVAGAAEPREPSRPARLVDLPATCCALLGADATGLAGEPLLVPRL